MLASARARLSAWIVRLFVAAVQAIQSPETKIEVLNWLSASRAVVGSRASRAEKFVALYKRMDARTTVRAALSSVAGAAKSYGQSNLPLAAKVALPATVLAFPFVAGQGAGLAAFGTAVGVPVLLLIFIGTAGITAIIEACATNEIARAYTMLVLKHIAQDEVFSAFRTAMRKGEQGPPEAPVRASMSDDLSVLRAELLAMDPLAFESHVMSFLADAGLADVAVTKKGADKGIDGFAKHHKGLIVVQCKRYATLNTVGGPILFEFSGAMQFHNAWRDYLVTTSNFTAQAKEIAAEHGSIVLVDLDELVAWHDTPPTFE